MAEKVEDKPFSSKFKKMFLTGILFLFPIGVTWWLLNFLIQKTQAYARPLVHRIIHNIVLEQSSRVPDWFITLISLVFVLFFVLLIGWLANFYIGKKALNLVDNLLLKLPFIRSIYGGTKQILDAFSLNRTEGSFKKVVMLEYPRTGSWVLGFITNENIATTAALFDRGLASVFIPSTPNPTTGFLLYLDPFELYVLDMDVEEAVKLIVSGGLVLPGVHKRGPIRLADQLGLKRREETVKLPG